LKQQLWRIVSDDDVIGLVAIANLLNFTMNQNHQASGSQHTFLAIKLVVVGVSATVAYTGAIIAH
jgi:anti-sigma-K factor RskA